MHDDGNIYMIYDIYIHRYTVADDVLVLYLYKNFNFTTYYTMMLMMIVLDR